MQARNSGYLSHRPRRRVACASPKEQPAKISSPTAHSHIGFILLSLPPVSTPELYGLLLLSLAWSHIRGPRPNLASRVPAATLASEGLTPGCRAAALSTHHGIVIGGQVSNSAGR